ncbi:MAG: hypothetical protein AUK02_05205 [Anaerolineae bacterium CG2_30_58_95]|nr:MAG: hypothetical protein AUK02_05205 [Anaerolineae bacterium CG2_30_58_95]
MAADACPACPACLHLRSLQVYLAVSGSGLHRPEVLRDIIPMFLRDIVPMFLRDIIPTFLRDIVPRSFREARERNAVKHALSGVLLHSGLRAGECADLRVQDLDLPGKRLIVRQGAA